MRLHEGSMRHAATWHSDDIAAEQELHQTPHQRAWNDVPIPENLGRDCGTYKWYQNQSYVHLHIQLPESVPAKQVQQI